MFFFVEMAILDDKQQGACGTLDFGDKLNKLHKAK